VIDVVASGPFERRWPGLFRAIVDRLTGEDRYLLCADFAGYLEGQDRANAVYACPERWWRMSILNASRMGRFSSDRTTREYADEIWGVRPA
jgi:glycogen phosphorylase